jgi:hypothetical protein
MSKVISAYDLLLADPLVGMNQFDLCHLDNAQKVYDVLATLGFDISKPVHIYAAQHRTMSNKVQVGYLFAGEHDMRREHIKGKYSTLEDVMLAAQAQDKSLYEELYTMNTRCAGYGGIDALDENIPKREQDSECTEEEQAVTKLIIQLEDILLHIRGDQIKADGSVKTLQDYENPEQPAEKKRKRNKKVKGTVDE